MFEFGGIAKVPRQEISLLRYFCRIRKKFIIVHNQRIIHEGVAIGAGYLNAIGLRGMNGIQNEVKSAYLDFLTFFKDCANIMMRVKV